MSYIKYDKVELNTKSMTKIEWKKTGQNQPKFNTPVGAYQSPLPQVLLKLFTFNPVGVGAYQSSLPQVLG